MSEQDFLTDSTVILGLDDLAIKELTIPDNIPAWGGKIVFIRQLNRGDQDTYLKRQYGETRMKQEVKRGKHNKHLPQSQEISGLGSVYGHDAFLCVRGMCNTEGKRIFSDDQEAKLKEKNGEAVGWIAAEIIKHSGMELEAKVARGEITEEEALEEEAKNS